MVVVYRILYACIRTTVAWTQYDSYKTAASMSQYIPMNEWMNQLQIKRININIHAFHHFYISFFCFADKAARLFPFRAIPAPTADTNNTWHYIFFFFPLSLPQFEIVCGSGGAWSSQQTNENENKKYNRIYWSHCRLCYVVPSMNDFDGRSNCMTSMVMAALAVMNWLTLWWPYMN